MLVLVTGATGFLGGLVVRQLLQAGFDVRALARHTSRTEELEALGISVRRGSLEPPEGLGPALDGVGCVVHCAGGGKARDTASFYVNNRDTTVRLLEACERAPVEHFVLISSIAAQGPSRDAAPPPADRMAGPISHYGRSKAEAEAAALERRQRMRVTVLRPPALYGPADTRMLGLFRAARRGVVPVPRSARASSMLYGDDCAAAVRLVVERQPPSGRVYGVEDGELMSTVDRARCVGAAVGRAPWVPRVPALAVRGVASLSEAWARLRGREALLTRDKARDLCQPWWVIDSAALRAETGWQPQVDFAEGTRRAARWYREHGWL